MSGDSFPWKRVISADQSVLVLRMFYSPLLSGDGYLVTRTFFPTANAIVPFSHCPVCKQSGNIFAISASFSKQKWSNVSYKTRIEIVIGGWEKIQNNDPKPAPKITPRRNQFIHLQNPNQDPQEVLSFWATICWGTDETIKSNRQHISSSHNQDPKGRQRKFD